MGALGVWGIDFFKQSFDLSATEAGAFSVPSKTLTYLCAARPILAAVPPQNAAAHLVTSRAGALVYACTRSAPWTGDP